MPRVVLSLLLLSCAACSNIQSSTVRTGKPVAAYAGQVRVLAFATQGEELGVVQVSGSRAIDELMPEFKRKVAELGGSLGVLDAVKTEFETQTRTETYTYGCGTSTAPRTCTGMRNTRVEVMTVQLLGRALR